MTATFFLTGAYIRDNPDLVRRIAAAGHEVGNHTWSHPHLTTWDRTRRHDTLPGLDRAVIQEELSRTARAYEAATGRTMAALWRAPFGEVNDDLLAGPRRRGGSTSAGLATTAADGTRSTASTGSRSAPRATT